MIDFDDNRVETTKRFGATATIKPGDGNTAETVMKMTGGRGVDTAIEAVGVPASFATCDDIVAPRHYRQHERSWCQGGSPLEAIVGAEHHDHRPTGRHGEYVYASEDGVSQENRSEHAQHAPLQA